MNYVLILAIVDRTLNVVLLIIIQYATVNQDIREAPNLVALNLNVNRTMSVAMINSVSIMNV